VDKSSVDRERLVLGGKSVEQMFDGSGVAAGNLEIVDV